MSSRRTLILIGAVVIGALAAFVLFSYVTGIEDEVNKDAELVDTVQAKGNVPRGISADEAQAQGLIGVEKIQRKFKPANAIDNPDQIAGRVAVFDIFENAVILDNMFVDASATVSTFRERIRNPEYATVTITLQDANAVGGNLTPGDFVNILAFCEEQCTIAGAEGAAQPIIEGLEPEGWLGYRYLYQQAHILAIGRTAALDVGEQVAEEGAEGGAEPVQENRGLITFDVPVESVQLLATLEIASEFSLYLSLVPKDYEAAAVPPLEVEALNALPGETGSQLTPYGPDGWQDQ